MTLQKWIEDRAIPGYPTFSVEDVRTAGLCSSEQILQNELSRLSSNITGVFVLIYALQLLLLFSVKLVSIRTILLTRTHQRGHS